MHAAARTQFSFKINSLLRINTLIKNRMQENVTANGCPFKYQSTNPDTESENKHVTSMTSPPGPRGPPLIGQAFNLDTDHLHIQFMEWQQRFGDMFMFKVFGKQYLVISHPDILHKMFVTCEHAGHLNDRPASFMGKYVIERTKDIVFRKFDEKQQILKMAALDYVENKLLEDKWFYEQLCEELKVVVNTLAEKKNSPVDITKTLDTISAKAIGLLLTGRRIQEEDDEFQCLCGFMDAGNELGTVKNQTILTTLPCVRKVPGHLKDTYDCLCEEKIRLKQYFITENKSDKGLVAMLKRLAASSQEGGKEAWLDEDFIMGVIMDLTAAAVVPLQHTLSVLFLVFVHYPIVQDKIREEIKDVTSSEVTIDNLSRMPYSAACMLELKRFHTPLPISARHSNQSGDAKFETYYIPKNTEIFSNLFGIHHDERFWPDPWTFKPERFLTPEGALIPDDHPSMKNLVATGVGPRRCIGSKFSENVIFLAATSILKTFLLLPGTTERLPSCDPRHFLPGVVTRAPDYTCVLRDTVGNN